MNKHEIVKGDGTSVSEIEEKFGAKYFDVLSKKTAEFFQAFDLNFENLEEIEIEGEDADGEKILMLKGEDTTIVFKLKNEFPPEFEKQKSEVNIVVQNRYTTRLPNSFNLRLTNAKNDNTFNVNQIESIYDGGEEDNFSTMDKFRFWTMLSF